MPVIILTNTMTHQKMSHKLGSKETCLWPRWQNQSVFYYGIIPFLLPVIPRLRIIEACIHRKLGHGLRRRMVNYWN